MSGRRLPQSFSIAREGNLQRTAMLLHWSRNPLSGY
jgi:hypothetical protein